MLHEQSGHRQADGPHNAEALMVDPTSGDVVIVTKEQDGRSGVYVGPSLQDGATATLERVFELGFGREPLSGSRSVTAADASADGARVVIRTYNRVFTFVGLPGTPVADLLASVPYSTTAPADLQGEAIALTPDGLSYYTLGEGLDQPLWRVDCP